MMEAVYRAWGVGRVREEVITAGGMVGRCLRGVDDGMSPSAHCGERHLDWGCVNAVVAGAGLGAVRQVGQRCMG